MYSECTYNPKINKTSHTLAKNRDLNELAFNEKGRKAKAALYEEIHNREYSECTFKPKTYKNPKYEDVEAHYSKENDRLTKEIKDFEKEKKQRAEQMKRNKEYEEIKDCTF